MDLALCGNVLLYYVKANVYCSTAFISEIVELRHIIGEELISKLAESSGDESDQLAVRDCFTALMTCPNDIVQRQLKALLERLQRNCW